jgi:hypothetical protein
LAVVRPDACIDCGTEAPAIDEEENTTIFTRATGWRLVLRKSADGIHVPEWRCGACWQRYRAAGGHVRPPTVPPGGRPKGPAKS